MSTNALGTQGMIVQVNDADSPSGWQTINDVTDISGPDGSKAEIDATALNDSAKAFLAGLPDNGSVALTLNYIPADTIHAQLRSDFNSATEVARYYRLNFTDSPITTWTWYGYISSFSVSGTVDDKVTASVSIRVKGTITEA